MIEVRGRVCKDVDKMRRQVAVGCAERCQMER